MKAIKFAIGIVIVIALGLVFAKNGWEKQKSTLVPTPSPSVSSAETQTSGVLACLPPNQTDKPITLECAYGLKTDAGLYFALDTTFYPDALGDLAIGTSVMVTGEITLEKDLENTALDKYAIEGVIMVNTLLPR